MIDIRQLYAYSVLVFILGFFLAPNIGTHGVFFAIFILLPFLFLFNKLRQETEVWTHPLFYCLLAYIVYMSLTSLWTEPSQNQAAWYKPSLYGLVTIIFCFLVSWLCVNYPKIFEKLLFLLLVAAFLGASLSIINWWIINDGDLAARLRGFTRARHSIQGAACYAAIFLLAIMRLGTKSSVPLKVFYALTAFLCLLFVIFAQTRGILIAMAVAMLVLFVLRREIKPLLIIGLIALVTIGLSSSWLDWSSLGDRLTRSMPYRMEIWQSVFNRFLEHPWLGYGALYDPKVYLDNFTAGDAHNIYLGILFHGGIIGFTLYAILMLCALYYAYVNRSQEKYLFALIVLIFASVAMMSDIGRNIRWITELWLYFWFPIGIILSTPRIAR
jgi:O-antigen ligase